MTSLCWVVAMLSVVFALIAWSPLYFARSASGAGLGPWYWSLDVIASLASQGAFVVLVACLVVLAIRRFVCAGVLGVVIVGLVVMPLSEPRLGRSKPSPSDVRLLVYNSHTYSNDIELKHAMLGDLDVDIAVVLETSTGMMDTLIRGEGFRRTHPYGWLPRSKWSGCPAVMSRFPVEPDESALADQLRVIRRELWDHLYRLEIVHAPSGSFALVQAHARSPRHAKRWEVGLDQLLDLADIVGRIEEVTGLPVVVAGDFNSPPTSVRARAFAIRSGLVRAKPAMRPGGTFPSWLPGWAALAIDGVYASPGVKVTSWEVVGSAGSDHRGVVVTLSMGAGDG